MRSVKFGLDAEIPHLVMEYCSGGNLAEMLQRVGRLPLPRALRLLDRAWEVLSLLIAAALCIEI